MTDAAAIDMDALDATAVKGGAAAAAVVVGANHIGHGAGNPESTRTGSAGGMRRQNAGVFSQREG
jgi:hypothetical protein